METEAFSAMVSVSSMKGQEVGKYFGRERGREREERNTCMSYPIITSLVRLAFQNIFAVHPS